MKISTAQKLDNYRNMASMIQDYKEQKNRFPTTNEFMEKLGMSEATVKRYKKTIMDHFRAKMIDKFNDEMVFHVEKTLKELDNHINTCRTIQMGEGDNSDKMAAGRNIVEAELDKIRLMTDAPDYLRSSSDYDVPKNEKEHTNRKSETKDRRQKTTESVFD